MMNRKIIFGLLVITLSFSVVSFTSAQTSTIPSWIKNVAGFWSEDKISDQDFLAGLQYLIDHGMLKVSSKESKSTVGPSRYDVAPIDEQLNDAS